MRRRTFLKGMGAAAVALARPALAQSAKPLIFVPQAGLSILDPIFTPIQQTVMYGHYVYDMLYSVDAKSRAVPQMVEGHEVSDDKLTWTLKLRPGLKFHDGERVLARDCVASVKRWGQRDAFGITLMRYTEEVAAVDDKTIRFSLKKPFGILPDALAHPLSSPCVIMPERLANTPVTQQITDPTGSGPLKLVKGEFVPGERAVFARNPDYAPRQEAPTGMGGGKVVNFDRIEWHTLPDTATAAAALQAGEVDWWDIVQPDLVDLLKADPNIKLQVTDHYTDWIRFNCGQPPFNNVEIRRAVAAAVDQTVFASALVGGGTIETCYAMYPCHVPGVEQFGKDVSGGGDFTQLAARIKAAGYNGEKLVLLSAGDLLNLAPMGPLVADLGRKLGLNVELQVMDLGTWSTRRMNPGPVSQGGWNMFVFYTTTPVHSNPVVSQVARGLGLKGWPGNNDDPELEARITSWIEATNDEERQKAFSNVQHRLWDTTPIVPLAYYTLSTAMRSDLTGYIPNTVAVPWGIKRA